MKYGEFKIKTSTLIIIIILYSSSVISADLYKWVDENGNIHYGDERPTEASHRVEEVELQPLNSYENLSPKSITISNIKGSEAFDEQIEITTQAAKEKIRKISPTDCFGPSPFANDTPLNREKLTKSQHKSFSILLSEMTGSWRGQAIYYGCEGQVNAPFTEEKQYSASADIRLKRFKDLTINFEMYSSENRTTTHENIELFLSEEHISFSHYQSDETVLLNESNHHIELWVENFPTAGVRNELVRIFEIKNKRFTIKQFQYVNGALTSIMQWNLIK